jgi:peptide deformylase
MGKDLKRAKKLKERARSKKTKEAKERQAAKARIDALMDKIVRGPAEVLTKTTNDFDITDGVHMKHAKLVVDDLTEVLEATAHGVGLAAPQIGATGSALVWRKTPISEISHMLNPKILSSSEDTQSMHEGCLSYPGFFVEVERPVEIEVEFNRLDETETHKETFKGWEARVLQHEIDHLNGVCKVGDSPEEERQTVKGKK